MSQNSEGLYVVCNILVDDDSIDPVYLGSRSDYFEVRWDGVSLRIPPGETKIVPFYLAEHFAKHLADYILQRDGHMMHDEKWRAPLISQIILRKADEIERPHAESLSGDRASTEGVSSQVTGDSEPRFKEDKLTEPVKDLRGGEPEFKIKNRASGEGNSGKSGGNSQNKK